jgi:hypothetical protein
MRAEGGITDSGADAELGERVDAPLVLKWVWLLL